MNDTNERSPGRRLREARERMNLSAARVAEQLRLEPQRLAALEEDRFDELGAAVYVRGHLRKYAELVGLPADELLAAFTEAGRAMPAPSLIPAASARDLSTSRRRNPMPVLALGALLLVVFALWWWFTRMSIDTAGDVSAPQPQGEEPVASEPAPFAAAQSPGTDASPVMPEVSSPAADSAGVAAAATTGGTLAVLEARFRTQSWFEVYDAADRRLVFELVPAGKSRSLRAVTPLRVLLGNASGAQLSLDGRAVQVPPALRVADTAWIEIDATGAVREASPPRSASRGE
jgi:cytoskeleton protein RodZ